MSRWVRQKTAQKSRVQGSMQKLVKRSQKADHKGKQSNSPIMHKMGTRRMRTSQKAQREQGKTMLKKTNKKKYLKQYLKYFAIFNQQTIVVQELCGWSFQTKSLSPSLTNQDTKHLISIHIMSSTQCSCTTTQKLSTYGLMAIYVSEKVFQF